MTREIHTLKREIRILGIDACRSAAMIGAIIRGGLYLDGILTFHETITRKLSEEIQESRYYPELRIIMLHDLKSRLDTRQLWKATGLPVIEITKSRLRRRHDFTKFEKRNKIIYA